jgi:hypothetical protein
MLKHATVGKKFFSFIMPTDNQTTGLLVLSKTRVTVTSNGNE